MKINTALAFTLCSIASLPALAQTSMFTDAFEEFSTARLWEFEEIPIDWKMEGLLQADLNEGLNNLVENNLHLAESSLTSVIKRDSTIWQAYYYRAAARKQSRKFKLAEADMLRALDLRGDFYEGLVELSKILHLNRQSRESERAVNKAIRLDRSRGAAYYLKGDINMSQKELRIAINNYKDCLGADSLFHDARIKLALLEAIAKNKISSALGHLDLVLSYDSVQKSALLFRSILVQEENKEQAIKDLSNLLTVSPGNVMALYFRGLNLAALEDYEGAFNDFHKVIKTTSTDENNFAGRQTWLDKKIDMQNAGAYVISRVYGLPEEDALKIREAYCHILRSEYDKSISVISKVSNFEQEPVAVYLKAVAFEHKGAHEHALRHYNFALALDNEIADAYKKRGIYRQELKQWDKSVEDFTAYLKLYPEAFFINRIRGVSYYHMNRFRDAIVDFGVYLENDSANNEVRGYRGMAYLKARQPLKAYVDFATSGNQQALDFLDIERLINSVLQAEDTTQALYCLDAILESVPYFTEGYVQKLKIHVARNEWKVVSDNIQRAVKNSRIDAARSKHSWLLTVQALVYSRNKDLDDAVKSLNEAIRFNKENDVAYLERGRLFLAMGKSSKAEGDFRAASALGNPQAAEMLATISDK